MLLFSPSVVFDFLWPHRLQHPRLLCPSPSTRICSNSCPLSQWCHSTISSSVIPFSSLQYFLKSGYFPMSPFFTSCGQSIGASASSSVLPKYIQSWFALGFAGLISLGLSRVFSSTTSSKESILRCSGIFMVILSHLYMTTRKPIALTIWTFVVKVMSLPFNTLSRFFTAFLLRSKHLLNSWSLSVVILEPKK